MAVERVNMNGFNIRKFITSVLVSAVIAFLLGMFVTVFCFRLKRWKDDQNRKDD